MVKGPGPPRIIFSSMCSCVYVKFITSRRNCNLAMLRLRFMILRVELVGIDLDRFG